MRKLGRRQKWTLAVLIAVGLLVVLLGLVAAGVLRVPASGPAAPVKIQVVCVTILQGTNATGYPWFGPSPFCMSGIGYNLPYSSAAGSTVNLPIPILNLDTNNHTLYSVQVGPPFTLQQTLPPLPYEVDSFIYNPEGIDGGLMVFVTLPNSPGLSAGVNVTINALGG